MPQIPPRQLVLDLAQAPRFGYDDYLVTSAVMPAHDMVLAWPRWPGPALLLAGPEGAGKSHLAAVWANEVDAHILKAGELDMSALDALPAGTCLAVENIDAADVSETALFHLLNLAKEKPLWTLLTTRQEPSLFWPRLRDLASRLRAIPVARIDAPDDVLMRAVLVKLFDDRQLMVDEGVIDYIVRHLDRSLGQARWAVDEIDREALAFGRRITRATAANVLNRLESDKEL